MKINKVLAAAVAVLGIAVGAESANATFINGTTGFSGGFSGVSTPVSTAPFFDINPGDTVVLSSTGDFAPFIIFPPFSVTSAGDIDTNAPGGTLYTVGGFTFSLQAITDDTNMPLICNLGLCDDSRSLTIAGAISGNGFEDTAYIGNWTANGACLDASGACAPFSYSATWSSSIVALGIAPIPEPSTGLLMGLGLVLLAVRRR